MMKFIKAHYSRISMMFFFSLVSLYSFAQDKGLDVDINVKKESTWYQQPWVWIVGGAVFILLLAAILKGSSKSE